MYCIAIDLGGTIIKIGLVKGNEILEFSSFPAIAGSLDSNLLLWESNKQAVEQMESAERRACRYGARISGYGKSEGKESYFYQ